jgi:hypothetical protein
MLDEKISEWKQKYGTIFSSHIGEVDYIWRPLARKECRAIGLLAKDEEDLHERICQAAVLWPENVDFAVSLAGVPDTLGAQILEYSGFGSPKRFNSLLAEYQAEMEEHEHKIEAIILSTFPWMTREKVESMSVEDLAWYGSRAIWIAQNPVSTMSITPNETPPEPEMDIATKKKKAQELRNSGTDPMIALPSKSKPYLPWPFGIGANWDREDVVNAVGKQIRERISRVAGRHLQ